MNRVTTARTGDLGAALANGTDDADTDGRSRRWQAHRAERLRELSRQARRAVHHSGPDLSMDEFAAAMGTSKSIVYRYFTDKAGLQAAVSDLVLAEMAEAFEAAAHSAADPRHRLREMVGIYMTMVDSSSNVYRFVTRADGGADLSGFLTAISRYVQVPLADALAAAGDDVELAAIWAAGMVGFVRGVGESWLAAEPDEHPTAEAMADLITHWLWTGADAGAPTPIVHER